MTRDRLSFALSLAGHAVGLVLLAWLGGRVPMLVGRHPAAANAVDVIFEAPPPPSEAVPPPPPAPPTIEAKPPPAPPPPAPPPPAPPPPAPAPVVAAPPPPIAEPPPRPPPKREVIRRVEPRSPPPRAVPEPPPRARAAEVPSLAPPPLTAPQTAALPPPAATTVSTGYRNALAQWFAVHKSYPESARNRGEEGEAVLRFRVDRGGRVLSYSLVKGTGYPDLDAAVEAMMRGAMLPPFPSDMAANDIEVSVPVRFSLMR